jgi:hypothetical protein
MPVDFFFRTVMICNPEAQVKQKDLAKPGLFVFKAK